MIRQNEQLNEINFFSQEPSRTQNFYEHSKNEVSYNTLMNKFNKKLSTRNFVPKFSSQNEQNFCVPKEGNIVNFSCFVRMGNIPSYLQNNTFINKNEIFENGIKIVNINIHKYITLKKNDLKRTSLRKNNECLLETTILEAQTIEGAKNYSLKILKNKSYANKFLYPFLRPKMIMLINHENANILYQSFLEVINRENFIDFLDIISENSFRIFYSKGGSNVVQKLLEVSVTRPEFRKEIFTTIVEKIKGNIEKMILDKNANYIIQKCLIIFDSQENEFIYEEIYNSFLSIALTKSGSCVIRKSLEYGTITQKNKILNLILQNTFFLISDQFGNYTYQYLLSKGKDDTIAAVYQIISKEIFNLCKKKYSSNAIEKIFNCKNKLLINKIANDLLDTQSKIFELVCNQYGNYIIQKILCEITDKILINKIIITIASNEKEILKLPYGKNFLKNMGKKFSAILFAVQN